MVRAALVFLGVVCSLALVSFAEEPDKEKELKLENPKSSIEQQVKLVLAADVENVRRCLIPEIRDRVTKSRLLLAHGELRNTKVDDILGRVEETTVDGRRAVNVFSRRGGLVTTLVEIDGNWLATTLWF